MIRMMSEVMMGKHFREGSGRSICEYSSRAYPNWAYEIWCTALGDQYAAEEYPKNSFMRLWLIVLAEIKLFLFGWWWYPLLPYDWSSPRGNNAEHLFTWCLSEFDEEDITADFLQLKEVEG